MSKRPAAEFAFPSVAATISGAMVEVKEDSPAVKQRKVVRDDTIMKVQKKLDSIFKYFTDTQKFVLTYEGLTLEKTLDRDFRLVKAGKGPTMGAEYIKACHKHFALQSSSSSQLAANDASEEIRPILREAYQAYKGRPINRLPLIHFFKKHSYLNNRETVGVAKAVLDQNPDKCPDQRAFVLCAMSWFRENDLVNKVGSSTKHSSLCILVFVITLRTD